MRCSAILAHTGTYHIPLHLTHITQKATDNFKLNLFGDEDSGFGAVSGRSGSGGGVLRFGSYGTNDSYRKQAGLTGMMNGMGINERGAAADGDDLLDLMDGAS